MTHLTIETRAVRYAAPCSRNDYGYATRYDSFVVDADTGQDIAGPFATGDQAMDARERIWESA